MRKALAAAVMLTACSTSVPPTNPYDAQNPDARAPIAVTVGIASDDAGALPGFVSCSGLTPTPCRVNVTVTADAHPTELQISADPGFQGASWTAAPTGPQPWVIPFDVPDGPDGAVSVHVRFRSAAQNVSSTFSASIQRKSSAPTAPSIGFPSLVPDGLGDYYTNVLPLPLSLLATGANRMRVSCDATQALGAQPWLAYNPSQTCVLVAGDGDRQLQASFMDEAGNVSATATATVRLQQTPPAPPVLTIAPASGTDPGSKTILTSGSTARTSSLQFAVSVAAPAAPALFSHLDASSSAFLPAVVAPDGLTVTFPLAPGDVVSAATSLLTVRAVDRAGNASAPATVTVVQEPPGGPAAATGLTFFTRPGSIQVSWTASVSRYAAGYQLSYGPTDAYGGAGADQGASPIHVGAPCTAAGTCRYVLTGLSNFQPEYLSVTSLSELQIGGGVAGGPVTPQPAGVTVVGTLPTSEPSLALAVADDRAYVVQTGGLQIVDLSNPRAPALLGKALFTAPIPPGGSSDVAVRWPYAYVAGSNGLYVFDIRNEGAPSRTGLYAATNPAIPGNPVRPVVAVALRWPRAYLHVAGRYFDVGAILDVVDVSAPAAPVRVNWLLSPAYGDDGYRGSVAVIGTTAYFGTVNNSNLAAASVAGVTAGVPPTWIASSTSNFTYAASHLAADLGPRRLVYAMEASSPGALRVFDYSNPGAPAIVATAPGVPNGKFAVAGGDVYLVAGNVLEVLDLADLSNPRAAGTLALPGTVGAASAVAVSGTTVVVAGSSGLAVLQAAHLQYPQARGQAQALGVLTGGARVEQRNRIAVVPGNGVALYDVGDPAAPTMVASNFGSFESGNDYTLGYGFAGGAALSGDLLFGAYSTQCNSGSGLMAYSLGAPYTSSSPGPTTFPCGVARTSVSPVGPCNPATRYFGMSAHGGHLFAARGGTSGAKALDVYDLASFAPLTACAYRSGFAAGPPAAATFPLAAEPRDVQVHRKWAFVAEVDGFEILDVATPTAPVQAVRQAGLSGVNALSARLGRCAGAPCYQVFLSTSGGLRAFTWVEGTASAVDAGALSLLGPASAVLSAHDLLVQGHAAAGGLGFFDSATPPGTFQSYSTPQPSGSVYAIGAAGRFVYANDNGSLVVQELQ